MAGKLAAACSLHWMCAAPRADETTNFSSGNSRDTVAGLLPSAESGAGVLPAVSASPEAPATSPISSPQAKP